MGPGGFFFLFGTFNHKDLKKLNLLKLFFSVNKNKKKNHPIGNFFFNFRGANLKSIANEILSQIKPNFINRPLPHLKLNPGRPIMFIVMGETLSCDGQIF